MLRTISISLMLVVLWFAAPVGVASAQSGADSSQAASGSAAGDAPEPAPRSVADLESQITTIEADATLDETVKATALDLYRQAIQQLRRAEAAEARVVELRHAAESAAERLGPINEELARPAPEAKIEPASDATLSQLEQAARTAEADLQVARRQVTELQSEAARRLQRRSEIPAELAALREQLAALDEAIENGATQVEPLIVADARRAVQIATRAALRAEIEAAQAEPASYEARTELLAARRDQAQRRAATAEQIVRLWSDVVSQRRTIEAQRTANEAAQRQREAARQHPVLKDFAQRTADLAAQRVDGDGVVRRIERADESESRTLRDLAALEQEFATMRQRLELAGLTRATGVRLRNQYERLPRQSLLNGALRRTRTNLERAEYALLERQEQRADFTSVDREVDALLEQIGPVENEADRDALASAARDLVTARRSILDQLLGDASTLLKELYELENAQRRLAELVKDHRAYIEERILWVRSVPGNPWPNLERSQATIEWASDGEAWLAIWRSSSSSVRERLGPSVLAAFVVIALFVLRRAAKRRLRETASLVSRYRTDAFRYTLEAAGLTLVLASPGPLLLALAAWLLLRPVDEPALATAFGDGFVGGAIVFYFLNIVRYTVKPSGLAHSHFRWSEDSLRPIRKTLRWFMPLAVILYVVVVAADAAISLEQDVYGGQVAFAALMLAWAIALHQLTRPKGPVLCDYYAAKPAELASRLRFVDWLICVAAPLALGGFALAGYLYTAMRLGDRAFQSLIALFVVIIASALMKRWLFVARRRLAIEDARRRREQVAHDSSDGQEVAPAVDEEQIDVPAISAQTMQFFRVVVAASLLVTLFVTWSDVLPALRMLDRVQIWPTMQVLEAPQEPDIAEVALVAPAAATDAGANGGANGSASNGAGAMPSPVPLPGGLTPATAATTSSSSTSVTLSDVGASALFLFVTWVLFRDLPAFLGIVVLQRLPLDAGARYALTAIVRYAIAIIGVSLAFSAIGLSWSSIQWLAAALTFGLAFGLQEIFANFVSGLIILAERPIRIGDTVTVGGVNGTVSKIRMRATTVIDWDRKELIIPNKTFITTDVINWTLSDTTLRLIIPVGVSYGADVEKVERTLKEIADQHPAVLKEPKPFVYFRQFGDSTLNFELRFFIPSLDQWLSTLHQMHMTITKRFREEDIEIAFPQRDLNIRSIGDFSKLVEQRDASARHEFLSQEPERASS